MYALWKPSSWGLEKKRKSAKWTDIDKAKNDPNSSYALFLWSGLMEIFFPVCWWLYGPDEPPACSCFCPAVCEALWDMTNGVLRLKDCGVWCECSLGRGEVNYLGLNSYFVPLWGSSQQTGEEGDASWTGCISRSLWKKNNTFFINFLFYFFTRFNPPVCPFDLCIWLKSETRFTRAIGHQYVPVWRYWKVMAAPLPPPFTLWRKEMSELFPNILLYKANWPHTSFLFFFFHLRFSLKNNIFPKPCLTVATPGKRSIFQWHMGLWGLQW